jgi:hypothetical protein
LPNAERFLSAHTLDINATSAASSSTAAINTGGGSRREVDSSCEEVLSSGGLDQRAPMATSAACRAVRAR